MFAALGQSFAPHLLAQRPQRIELLVVELRPAVHTSLTDLAEPLGTIAARINLLADTRNGPTAVRRLEACHHASHIAADHKRTARQFLQDSYACAPWSTDRRRFKRNNSASFRTSIRSLLLPAFSTVFLRGLHTSIFVTCGFRKSYNLVAQVPSSKVKCESPCNP
jgi:hypothetical protein